MINSDSGGYANQTQVEKITEIMQGHDVKTEEPEKKATPDESNETTQENPELAFDSDLNAHPDDAKPAESSSDEPEADTETHISLKDLANTLDVDTKDLYDVEIPIGADKVVPLGELKDTFKKYESISKEQADFQEHKTRAENELMVARRQIEQLIQLGASTGQLTPEIVSQLDQQHTLNMTRERNALMQTIPEWKDATTRQQDFEQMVEVMQGYGFSRPEIESVMDHRLVKFVHDMTKRINLVKEAKRKAAAPKNTGKSRRTTSPKKSALSERIQRAKSGTQQQKVEAISSLIS